MLQRFYCFIVFAPYSCYKKQNCYAPCSKVLLFYGLCFNVLSFVLCLCSIVLYVSITLLQAIVLLLCLAPSEDLFMSLPQEVIVVTSTFLVSSSYAFDLSADINCATLLNVPIKSRVFFASCLNVLFC